MGHKRFCAHQWASLCFPKPTSDVLPPFSQANYKQQQQCKSCSFGGSLCVCCMWHSLLVCVSGAFIPVKFRSADLPLSVSVCSGEAPQKYYTDLSSHYGTQTHMFNFTVWIAQFWLAISFTVVGPCTPVPWSRYGNCYSKKRKF